MSHKIYHNILQVIYVIRNPKDQMVSFYHFTRKFLTSDEMREVFGEDWNQFVTNCLAGKILYTVFQLRVGLN